MVEAFGRDNRRKGRNFQREESRAGLVIVVFSLMVYECDNDFDQVLQVRQVACCVWLEHTQLHLVKFSELRTSMFESAQVIASEMVSRSFHL